MAESDQLKFTHQEITAMIIKQQKIHEGTWSAYVEFDLSAIDASLNGRSVLPTALVSLRCVGIQRCVATHALAVDAAVVNPPEGQMPTVQLLGNGKERTH